MDDAPSKGQGNLNTQMKRETAHVTERDKTTAEDCFNKFRLAVLNAKFIAIYNKGTTGAP